MTDGNFTRFNYGGDLNRQKKYDNLKSGQTVVKINLFGYSNRLAIEVIFDAESFSSRSLLAPLCQEFPSLNQCSITPYRVTFFAPENEKGIIQLSKFLDYIHQKIEPIEKEIREDMRRTIGCKKINDDDEVYAEIINLVEDNKIDQAIGFATNSDKHGHNLAFYKLGNVLHAAGYLQQAFEAFEKVGSHNIEAYHDARYLLAILILELNEECLDKKPIYAQSFKYLDQAGDSPDSIRLRQAMLDHYVGGNGFSSGDLPSNPKGDTDTVLFYAQKSSNLEEQLRNSNQKIKLLEQKLKNTQIEPPANNLSPSSSHPLELRRHSK